MNTPTPPIKKSAQVGTNKYGKPVAGPNVNGPNKRSAQPFGRVDKSMYVKKPVGLSPSSVPINDKDAGRGTGNARGGKRSSVATWKGVD